MLRTAIERPIAICMLFLALVLIGVLSFRRLPVDLLPAIAYPRLTVLTSYEEIPAEDLERLVTQPLEEVLTGLTGVRSVVSRTREGISTITVEYEWGTQMDFANLHLREAIDRVAFREDFPEDAERPVILRWDPTSRPISILVLEGGNRIEALTDFAREVVKPALEQVDGVSQGEVVGGADREILVQPDPRKLAIYNIDIEDISSALARSNISFPGGKIRQGPLHLSLRIAGEYETLEEIRKTDIVRPGRSPVRVEDVAEVYDTIKEPEGVTLIGGKPVVSILVYKDPEANTIQVAGEIDKSLEVLSADYGEFGYSFVYRDADYVRASFKGLAQSLVVGAFLAFFILFFFLRDFRSPVVVGLSIPVSIFITFALLYFGKVNLNLMSLGGLSLAAGMLVDNAIVVLENISRHLGMRTKGAEGEGMEGTRKEMRRMTAEASDKGAVEMARPVIAATLTTVAVFFPVVYVPGIAGAFFRDQALSVTFSLLVSVFAALLLQPMLSARVLKPTYRSPRGLFKLSTRMLDGMYSVYHRGLVKALRRPGWMLAALVFSLAVVAFLGTRLERGFLPERSSGDLRLDLEFPAGTPLEETAALAAELGEWVEADPAVAKVFTQVGRTERTLAAMKDYTAPHTARMRVILKSGRGNYKQGQRLKGELTERLTEKMTGVDFVFREEGIGLAELIASGGPAFSLNVIAEEPNIAVRVAEGLKEELLGIEGLTEVYVDRVIGTPNLVVRLDREEILRAGLDPERVARELRNRIAGVEATTFNEVEQRIDIAVRLPEEDRRDLSMALASPVEVGGGRTVSLRSFLDITEEAPIRELVRNNQRRMVTVTGDVSGRSVGRVWKDAEKVLANYELPGGVMVTQGGERAEMERSFRDLGLALLLAMVLVYMILAAQFESFLDPLLIAAVIPIGIAGSLIAIGVTGHSINILSIIGALALLGISVNDAIVKIDTMRRLRKEGVPARDAIMEASRLRFRPILMTSATTILAMIPMAIGIGSGEQLQRPLAITIIGGLALTTVLTLLYTPILYKVAHRIRGEIS